MFRDCSCNCFKAFSDKIKTYFQENASELKNLLFLAVPLMLLNFLDYAQILLSVIFVGHVGKLQLSALTLAITYTSLFGLSIGFGLNVACDTLLSQVYGSKNLKHVGVIVQRAILIFILACFPYWAFCVNTENILLLCRQDKDLARETELCVLALIPSIPITYFFQLQLRYLQIQEIIWPQILACTLSCTVTSIINYLLLYVANIGAVGVAISISIGNVCECTALFLYIRITKIYVPTWPDWSIECLKDWWGFLSVGIAGIVIASLEFWSFQMALLLAGLFNLVDLGSQSIMCQVLILILKIPFSLGVATSIRVGTFVGAGESQQAKKSSNLSIILTAISTILVTSFLIGLRTPISKIFSHERDVVLLSSEAMPFSALFFATASPSIVFIGFLKGIGKPEIGAFAFGVGYCILAFPLGALFMFVVKLGIQGFWIGMAIAFVCVNAFYCIYYLRINWDHILEKAQERAGLRRNIVPSHLDTTEDKELANYASLSSSSSETELNEKEQSTADLKARKSLIIRRILQALAVISTLLISLIIRVIVKYR